MTKFVLIVVAAIAASSTMAFPAQQIEGSNENHVRVIRAADPDPIFFNHIFGGRNGWNNAESYGGPTGSYAGTVGQNYGGGYDGNNYYGGANYRSPYDGYNGYNGYNSYNGYGNGGGGYNNYYPSQGSLNSRSNAIAASFKIPFISASISRANSRSRPAGLLGLLG